MANSLDPMADDHGTRDDGAARFVAGWEASEATGAVVVVDVLRAFTTAAYAFAAGAHAILLVDSVAEALARKASDPSLLLMGEDHGRRPAGFDFSNSPVEVSRADLSGRTLVQRTSAGTRGVVAARLANRLWCASLVCASATAAALCQSGLRAPTYVISGRFADDPDRTGDDDLATAELIEQARAGTDLGTAEAVERVAGSLEAMRTLALGPDHVHPDDVRLATQVDAVAFAMEIVRTNRDLRLEPRSP